MFEKQVGKINNILSENIEPTPIIISDIQSAFYKGLSLRHLVRMLESEILNVVEGATWIISELNPKQYAGVEKLAVKTLSFSNAQSRYHGAKFYYYYECIDKRSLWPLIRLLDDEAYNPRRMAMMALSEVGDYYWDMARNRNPKDEIDVKLVKAIKLLKSREEKGLDKIFVGLDSTSKIDRSIALLTAFKLLPGSKKCIEYATKIDDDAVSSVAKRRLDI